MKKTIKITLIGIISLIIVIVIAAGGYVAYVSIQYYRIEDLITIETVNPRTELLAIDGEYSVITYNIGFGAYNHDFSFFMDSGRMLDGTYVSGSMSKAANRQVVLDNTNGAISAVKAYEADFYLYQEVDTNSTRSHFINQYEMISDSKSDYASLFAVNFHSAYLLYPINDFHGRVNSGIATFSRFSIDESVRYSFPVDLSFPNKFFDLDRCFVLTRLPLNNGKELVLINLHMSAYDEGGLVRARQLELLNTVLSLEHAKGNYVIAGGDFNHDIAGSVNHFATEQEVPEWVFVLNNSDLPDGFSFAAALNAPTCRSTDMPYVKGVNYTVVIDGYIVSDNINVSFIETIDLDFVYSDHNPVLMRFTFVD